VESAFQLQDAWAVIRKRRQVALTFFAVLVGVVLVGTLNQKPIYRATVTIVVLPDTPKVVSFQEVEDLGASNYFLYQDYFNTQHKILRSNSVAALVIDRLGLTEPGPGGTRKALAPERLIENLEVEPVKESQLVRVSYQDPNAQQAARVANTVAQVYLEENLNQRVHVTKQAVDFLAQRLTELKDQVVRSENEVFKFKRDNDIVGWDEKHNLVLQKLVDLNAAYSKVHTERVELEARARRLRSLVASGTDRQAILPVIESNLIQQLKEHLVDLERQQSELAGRYRPGHPKMQRLTSQVTLLKGRVDAEVSRVIAAVGHEYELKYAEERSLGAELDAAKAQAMELNRKLISHASLQQEAETNQKLYDIILGRLKETDIASNLRANNARVIDAADTPPRPVKPNVPLNLSLALLLGLVGGVGLAFCFEYLDDTLKTQDDVARHLGLPLLGVVPAIEPGEAVTRDLYVHTHPKSTIAESLRSLRTSLDFLGAARPLRTLMITSATPLEGKSTTSANLGAVLAQAGRRVVLIDTDLRRSRLHKSFGLANERGFSNLLLGSDDLASVVQATEVPGLSVIPSGPLPPNPSELLGSRRMDEILALLGARFDVVLFDTPPVIAVTDATVLGRKLDGTIFVVKSGQTRRGVAAEACRRLNEVGLNVVGVVLNGVDTSPGGYGYQYAYEYGAEAPWPA
jgi:capsular exopolysaccharide synthesis family protein